LLERGIITKEQLDRALSIQEQTKGMLGDILIKNGFVTEEQLIKAFSRQFGLPFASRANGLLVLSNKEEIRSMIPEDFSRSHQLAPLFIRDDTMGVAVADPMDVVTMDNLRILSGKNLLVYLATRADIASMQEALYRSGKGGDEIGKMAREAAESTETLDVPEVVEEKADLDRSMAEAGEARVVQLVNQIIRQALEDRASDIHLEPMEDIVNLRFRIDGVLHEKPPPSKVLASPIVSRIKILSKLNVAERRLPQDGSFAVKHRDELVDIRVSVCPTVWGEKVVMRILSKKAVELNVRKLGMEPKQQEDFLKAANYPHGLILLTGPTGSGKTTTLYSILSEVKSPEINIMTIEDPVEFQIRGINQVQVKPQIGLTFAAALRSFLRQDPDVILVGEIRDAETSELAMRAAMTGHLVLSTLHTNDSLSAILRLRDLGVEPFLLSSTIVCVAAQRLVRVLCAQCRQVCEPDKGFLAGLGLPAVERLYKPKGCAKCVNTGYAGRKAIYEVVLFDEQMRVAVQQNKPITELREVVRAKGVMLMRDAGFLKVSQGITDLDEYLATIIVEA
ncbi:MAG: Flp pilus assembly complex ATPase component TadA, partial [Elusimicrobia bacterium]|nr:Flp pilus assembly complex ATPase component TadA [Elusimicrobiota bacterium]